MVSTVNQFGIYNWWLFVVIDQNNFKVGSKYNKAKFIINNLENWAKLKS